VAVAASTKTTYMPLTDTVVRDSKRIDKPVKTRDGDGLYSSKDEQAIAVGRRAPFTMAVTRSNTSSARSRWVSARRQSRVPSWFQYYRLIAQIHSRTSVSAAIRCGDGTPHDLWLVLLLLVCDSSRS